MASPQRENGYTGIANEIIERLVAHPVMGRELSVILFVIRKTYGYGKKVDWISLSQFSEALKVHEKSVCRLLRRLVTARLLIKKENGYGFNKNWEEWVVTARLPSNRSVPKGNRSDRYKRNLTKEKQLAKQKVSPSPSVGPDPEPPPPVARPPSPIQAVVGAYMDAQGFLPTQRAPAFSRNVQAAKKLLQAVGGNVEAAITAIWECKRWSGTRTWTLETVLNHLHRFMELS